MNMDGKPLRRPTDADRANARARLWDDTLGAAIGAIKGAAHHVNTSKNGEIREFLKQANANLTGFPMAAAVGGLEALAEAKRVAEQAAGVSGTAEEPAHEACTKPPPGWVCSRDAGHDGPCAASPIESA